MNISDLPAQYQDQARRLYAKRRDTSAVPVANVEQTTFRKQMEAKTNSRHGSLVDIHVHSKRRRLTDSEGVSAKAAIDAIVNSGILIDDSPKYVRNTTFTQEKSTTEETIISIRTAT